MKANTITKKTKSAKRTDRGVPFGEMRRLMAIYGSIKCLRKRQSPIGEDTKIDSVKRKFYRWFPDLEERFIRDENGVYLPKAGHQFELRYREEMRTKDGEILAKKRTMCRKDRKGGKGGKAKRTKPVAFPLPSIILPGRVSPVSVDLAEDGCSSIPPPSIQEAGIIDMDITLDFDHDLQASSAITADTEPVDRSFIAEKEIFDHVEESFFGSPESELEFLSSTWLSSSSSSDEPALLESNYSSDRDSPSIEDMLEKSIEECYEEILGSSDDDSVSGYLFDMISG